MTIDDKLDYLIACSLSPKSGEEWINNTIAKRRPSIPMCENKHVIYTEKPYYDYKATDNSGYNKVYREYYNNQRSK